jgi:hypothetical protein
MIYTTADRIAHIASAMETISPEYAAQLRGYAQYVRALESANIRLGTELREAQQLIEETGNSIDDAELEAFADKVRDAHDVAIANECRKLDDAELASLNLPTYATLADLIASLP